MLLNILYIKESIKKKMSVDYTFFEMRRGYYNGESDTISNEGTLKLYFGKYSCRDFLTNAITIIPNGEVLVSFKKLNDSFQLFKDDVELFEGDELFNQTINESMDVYQRMNNNYKMELIAGKNGYISNYFIQGILKIEGNCTIIQKPIMISDR